MGERWPKTRLYIIEWEYDLLGSDILNDEGPLVSRVIIDGTKNKNNKNNT